MLNKNITLALGASTLGVILSSTASFATGQIGVVTTSTLNVRSGPSTSYSVTGKVHKNDKVEILESSNGWHKIKTSSGTIGWSSGDYISIQEGGGTTTPTGQKLYVTTGTLNVRSGPSTSYSVVTKVHKGDAVETIESSNGWYKIKTSSGKIGWASGDYLSSSNPGGGGGTTTPTEQKLYVTTGTLNVRSGPSTSYSVVTKVYKGDAVESIESSNGWYKIKTSSGKIGWASGEYLSTTNPGGSGGSESNKVQAVINLAYAQIGKPYVWGAEGPSSFDCSGLMTYIFKNGANINLPRTSTEQSRFGTTVNRSDLKPGDLIFSSTNGSGSVSHVGIYVGNNEMIHAPKPGDVVKKTSINNSYWNNAYLWSKRVL